MASTPRRTLNGRPLPRFAESLDKGALRGKRLGVLRNYMTGTDGDVADSIRATTRAMSALGAELVDVSMPDLDSLLAGSGVIPLEFKWDLMDYLAKNPGALIGTRVLEHLLARARTDADLARTLLGRPDIPPDRTVATMFSSRLSGSGSGGASCVRMICTWFDSSCSWP